MQLKRMQREQTKLGHQKLLLLHLKTVGLPTPIFEYKFHETRKWSIDAAWWFCWIHNKKEVKLALEIEGGIYGKGGGGHRSVAGFESNLEKYNELSIEGWFLIRILPEWLHERRNEARELLVRFFEERATSASVTEPTGGLG